MSNADLRDREALSKKLAIEEFKSSRDFQEAVEDASLKYFSEGFDFCKRQLRRHHLELGINLENIDLDVAMLEEEEEELEEEKGKEGKDKKTREKDGD